MVFENLKKGNTYFYWSKSIYEKRASLKECVLLTFNKTHARVLRSDLDINKVQVVAIKRLKPSLKLKQKMVLFKQLNLLEIKEQK